MAGGNNQVILCERGIRTFEKYTRNTLDLSVVPIIKRKSHLPIIIDPSHATGDSENEHSNQPCGSGSRSGRSDCGSTR